MSEAFLQSLIYFGILGCVALGVAIKVVHDDKRREKNIKK